MIKKFKISKIVVLTLILFSLFSISTVCSEENIDDGTIINFSVNDAGLFEFYGYTDNIVNSDITILITDADPKSNSNFNVLYVNQIHMGNNGAFYLKSGFNLNSSGSDYVLLTNIGNKTYKLTGNLGEFTLEIMNVPNNCIRIGNDIYSIGVNEYTPNNIATSLAEGGNYIDYKIGDYWFNVLDENATSYQYFIKDNAVPESEWHFWNIKHYYYDIS